LDFAVAEPGRSGILRSLIRVAPAGFCVVLLAGFYSAFDMNAKSGARLEAN